MILVIIYLFIILYIFKNYSYNIIIIFNLNFIKKNIFLITSITYEAIIINI